MKSEVYRSEMQVSGLRQATMNLGLSQASSIRMVYGYTCEGQYVLNVGGCSMSEAEDWNQKIIDEFRANHGVVGGPFEGMSLLLVHHKGAKSGKERVNPLAYQ